MGLDKPVSTSTTGNSLRRLLADGTIAKVDYAEYRFEDEVFAGWILLQGS